jgi:hypothetical protein
VAQAVAASIASGASVTAIQSPVVGGCTAPW